MLIRTFFVLILIITGSARLYASNAGYITLSNQVARKQELEIITNNSANANTTGFEEDSAIFNKFDVVQNKRKKNSFVVTKGMYKPGDQGPLKYTNNPLDIAIVDPDQYFKVSTRSGIRYTLSGAMFRNSQNILVTTDGFPFLTINNDILQVPEGAVDVTIASDGMVYADNVPIEKVGVVSIPNKYSLEKQGNSLYKYSGVEIPLDSYTIVSGALRASNVDAARIMSQIIETQRSFSITTTLLNDIGDMEKQSVSRILKQ